MGVSVYCCKTLTDGKKDIFKYYLSLNKAFKHFYYAEASWSTLIRNGCGTWTSVAQDEYELVLRSTDGPTLGDNAQVDQWYIQTTESTGDNFL